MMALVEGEMDNLSMRKKNTTQLLTKYIVISVVIWTVLLMVGCADSHQSYSPSRFAPSLEHKEGKLHAHPEGFFEVEVEKAVLNLGEVAPGTRHRCEFKFTNVGDKAFVVDQIRGEGSCIMGIPQLEKKEYQPGESGVVKASFQAPYGKGESNGHLYIVSTDPVCARLELTIKANVVVAVQAMPETVDLLLDQENAAMSEITLESLDGKAFSIQSVSVRHHSAMTIPFDPIEKARQFTLVPIVDIEKLTQHPEGFIQIETDHPKGGVQIVRYAAKPFYKASRPRILLQNVNPQQEYLKTVVIRSQYGKTVKIKSAQSKKGYVKITAQQDDGEQVQLDVAITPPKPNGRYFEDELIIVFEDEHELKIKCSGWFKKDNLTESIPAMGRRDGGSGMSKE